MRFLYIVPARKGSVRLPGKNKKILNGYPLFWHSVMIARSVANDNDICLSTNDLEIVRYAEENDFKVPFIRPENISSEKSSTESVIKHALSYYKDRSKVYDAVVLLQPTSPLRLQRHITEICELYSNELDMVVSVQDVSQKFIKTIFIDNGMFLKKLEVIDNKCQTNKMCKMNGSLYVINARSIMKNILISKFEKVRPYYMKDEYSIDIDTIEDWKKIEKKHK